MAQPEFERADRSVVELPQHRSSGSARLTLVTALCLLALEECRVSAAHAGLVSAGCSRHHGNACRARERLDMTVPMGMPITPAYLGHDSSSSSRSTSTSRKTIRQVAHRSLDQRTSSV